MHDKTFLRTLLEYNEWANDETYRKVAELPPEEITKKRKTLLESIFVSLHHLHNTDTIWLSHMQGKRHNYGNLREVRMTDFDELRIARKAKDQDIYNYFDSLSEADLEEVVEYELIGGNKGNMTRTMCFMHIVNHSSYHRGWISDMFGQADALQPTTDIPVFERARREAGGPPLPV